jgi:putative glutamine amidotransferase
LSTTGSTGTGLRIGVSAAFFHADPLRAIFKGKTLKYVEQELVRWIMLEGALPYVIPSPPPLAAIDLTAYARDLDGLVLQGGSDVAPESYGEMPLRAEWSGDRIRDIYELALLSAFMEQKKPILGVCRGAQLINVAMQGTLYQDIETQVQGGRVHRNWDIYDQLFHDIEFSREGQLRKLYQGSERARVCSVHHQAIKDLGQELVVEARSDEDGIIEAVRHTGELWILGVQWHPEWHDPENEAALSGAPILRDFLQAARRQRENNAR